MTVLEAAEALGLEVVAGQQRLEGEIAGGCVSDLLSYVMASAKAGHIWVTIQVHANIIGVAELLDLSAIVVADGQQPEGATIERARERGVALLTSREKAFTLAGKLYALGIR